MNNIFEVAEVLSACENLLEMRADDDRTLWAIIAALRLCLKWIDDHAENL